MHVLLYDCPSPYVLSLYEDQSVLNCLFVLSHLLFLPLRWSGFLLCAVAMLLVIFPMFAFPKKLPPRHKKRKRKKIGSPGNQSSDDDVMKEKSSSKDQNVTSSMGFGKDIKGEEKIISDNVMLPFPPLEVLQVPVAVGDLVFSLETVILN